MLAMESCPSGPKRSCRSDLEHVTGQKWKYGECEGATQSGVREAGQPERSTGEDEEIACGGAEER